MKMKKYAFMLIAALLFFCACSDNEVTEGGYKTYPVTVQLAYPSTSQWSTIEGVQVKLTDTNGSIYTGLTNADGKVAFTVPAGIYGASTTDKRAVDGYASILNGLKSNIIVTETWTGAEAIVLDLTESKAGQVIIKELYVGGCQKSDGSGKYINDQYVILYNNSEQTATLENFCLGMVSFNANGAINDYVNGVLSYADAGYIPAGTAIWYLPSELVIEPGKQITIALNGAINHTLTYSNSVDLSRADYCTYDIADFSHTSYYPSPSEYIPTSHYFSAYKYGQGTGWALSISSPSFFIFSTHGMTPVEFAADASNFHYIAGKTGNATYACKKVPTEWILDGLEVFDEKALAKCNKRLTSTIDAGYASLTNTYGHTSYRNVDKTATEAIADNKGKLVYGYSKGTEGSTDASGIDAEASLKNGARIVYQDTNNSSSDFHQRTQASLRD